MTFLEAYQRSGRILNIGIHSLLLIAVVSYEHPSQMKLLNYISAPDVLVSSAVLVTFHYYK
jgi:hypothetical protein